jgi:diguanylate cyclase (GGDEF)-like protein
MDEATGAFNLVCHTGLSAAIVEAIVRHEPESGLTRIVMSSQPVYARYTDLGIPMDEVRLRENLKAIAIIPMRYDDRIIAVMGITSHSHEEVPDFSRTALETIAGQLGQAIARVIYEDKLRYLSMHDMLTGLYNRAFFEEELLRLSKSREYPITILVADADGLKQINDRLGHVMGDALLKACGEVLGKSSRASDIVARIGGDEFSIILPRADQSIGEKIIFRIRSQVNQHNQEYPELPLCISIGVATAVNEKKPLKEIYKDADNRMYHDKLKRKGLDS